MKWSKRLIHRALLLAGLTAVVVMLAVACAAPTPAPAPTPTSPPAAEVPEGVSPKQAPMLQELVEAGELPPLEERLPEDVQVVEVVEEIGQYGGTWFTVHENPDMGWLKMIMYDPPIRWKEDYTGYEPGLAKSWELSDDGKTLTLHFRRGVKWSDGEPFTMEDMEFWWEDIATNKEYKVVQVPWWGFKSTGEPMDVEFPDDYTMVMRWDTPQWTTPFTLAQGFWEWEPLMKPKHYLQQFHPDYNPDSDYSTLEEKDQWWQNPDYPTLFAWHTDEYEPGERVVFERNPYYWKVDPEGNQLPYIDRIESTEVAEPEVRLLMMTQGKISATFRASNDPRQIPVLLEKAEEGDYRILNWMNGAGGWPCWLINQSYVEDEEIAALLRNKNLRKGLSHALNRQRVVDVVWEGIGTPQQATISPQSWHFQSPEGQEVFGKWQKADAEYDPELAQELFEKADFVDQDGDGWRDLPSGKPFELIIDVTGWAIEPIGTEASEILKDNLEAVGVHVAPLNIVAGTPESDLRQEEGQYMLRTCHASEVDIWTYPDWIFPVRDNRAWPMQGKWRQTGGEEGWKPEPESPAARLQALYDEGLAEADPEKRHEIVWEAIQIHIEEGPFTLGAAGDQPMPVVVKNNFRNVPETGILGPWAPGSPGNKHPEQFFIKQE